LGIASFGRTLCPRFQSVTKIFKEGFHDFPAKWTARMPILRPEAHNHCMIYQKLVYTLPDAEAYTHPTALTAAAR